MYLSLNWLKEFVHIPKAVTPEELGTKLTLHTVEVEGITKDADRFKDVVVGKILEIEKHPNADRLKLTKVDVGTGTLAIVCGADNISVGNLVPVALPGAVLPGGMEIKEAEVRGVKSSGMLCALDELGLGDDHSGIMQLKKAKVGQNFGEYLKLTDTILEVDNKSITNRPDLWSHLGMARDISAFLKVKMTKEADDILKGSVEVPAEPALAFETEIRDKDLCLRYMAVAMKGIKIEPSPEWLKEKIAAVGMRPINNIVDITNYVMLEMGQPLHAFDLNRISPDPKSGLKKIIIRRAAQDEAIETLDNAARQLDSSMLLIADSDRPLAIAGVMGGAGSEIGQETVEILIESANFEHASVRKTSTKLGLRTESSMRFEKSLDPNLCAIALARAVSLIRKVCPSAEVASRLADEKNFELMLGPVSVSLSWIKEKIGADMENREIIGILERLGFVADRDHDTLAVFIPTWRAGKDIVLAEDIAEEVARIHGFNNITPKMPEAPLCAPERSFRLSLKRRIRNALTLGARMSEVYNYSFVGEDQLKKLGIDYSTHLRLANPIASNLTMLRQNLAPNLFENIKKNQARTDGVRLFEFGNVFLSTLGEYPLNAGQQEFLPFQEERIGLAVSGNNAVSVFAEVKNILAMLSAELGVDIRFAETELAASWADHSMRANAVIEGKEAGKLMRLDRSIGRSIGIKQETVVCELSLYVIEEAVKSAKKTFHEFEKYPAAVRDLAFVLDKKVMYADIHDAILSFSDVIKSAVLFDVYEGDKVGSNRKSLAFHVRYQSDRTLRSEEVDELQAGLFKVLEEKFEAKVRDF